MSELSDRTSCTTADCRGRAVRYVSCEGEGSYPYCQECTDTLLSGGHEDDHGPVDDPLLAEVKRLREALEQAGRRLHQIQRDRTERDKVYAYSTNGLSEIARALDEDQADG